MKQYEFHSSLTPEQVFARLAGRAKCGRDPIACDGKFRYVRWGDCFSLTYSGKRSASGFFPFQGRVEQKGDGSLISGDFGMDYCFLSACQTVFFRKRRQLVLNFIKENLLGQSGGPGQGGEC